MAIPDPSKAGSPFPPLQTGGWNPKSRKLTTFLFPYFLSGGVTMKDIKNRGNRSSGVKVFLKCSPGLRAG